MLPLGVQPDQSEKESVVVPPAVRGWNVCRMHGARGDAPEGRHGARSKETIELWKLIKSLR
jgi:hypothetical protein